ncbi:hypothetical protein BDN70DRAFT_796385 [Pholiota conissans]|uniref:RecQ-mediated genome instability protein 1 n=1 Tax=Pholiota conissans TaxID=109636 RepID=A0A9P5ZDV3_9AGAR|nr:hypothetical protein BDN70DRAFT_796385 [Pholiota conissans]
MAPPAVVQWVNRQFPKPTVDLEWLDGCCEWLVDDQKLSPETDFPQFIEYVKVQLLESDLADSMSKGTGLRPNIVRATEDLKGPPILVQIIAMTEIGTSAFQLEQTRVAREERMRSGQGNVEGDEEGDVEVEGEGPMPKYPRGTLRFQLSDGETIIEAMEYRTLPQLALGITELGYKMQLKGTRIQNGMALLEPATVNLLGGRQTDLEARQLTEFKQGLRTRLGRPYSPEPEPLPQPPAAVDVMRSPLREISPPPVPQFVDHNDDVDIEPRRRIPANSSLNNPPSTASVDPHQPRPIIGLPSRHTRASLASNDNDDIVEIDKATAISQNNKITKSAYFDENTGSSSKMASSSKQMQDFDFTFTSTIRQSARTLPSPSPELSLEPKHPGPKDEFDFDFLDELGANENQPPSYVNKGKAPEHGAQSTGSSHPPANNFDPGSDDYGMDDIGFVDADFWDRVDQVVEKANAERSNSLPVNHPPSSASASGSGTSSSYVKVDKQPTKKSTQSRGTPNPPPPTRILGVIEIDDSDEEMGEADDKENQPVPTRHVRQRMDNSRQTPALSQRTGRPVVLASKPEDVINLTDSD